MDRAIIIINETANGVGCAARKNRSIRYLVQRNANYNNLVNFFSFLTIELLFSSTPTDLSFACGFISYGKTKR